MFSFLLLSHFLMTLWELTSFIRREVNEVHKTKCVLFCEINLNHLKDSNLSSLTAPIGWCLQSNMQTAPFKYSDILASNFESFAKGMLPELRQNN